MKGECVLRAPLTYGKTVEGVPNGTLLSSVSGGVDNKGILQAPFGEVINPAPKIPTATSQGLLGEAIAAIGKG